MKNIFFKNMTSHQRELYDSFLRLNVQRGSATTEPTAHVVFCDSAKAAAVHTEMFTMTIEDVKSVMDSSSTSVEWLLQQMTTYDFQKQKILVMQFDRQTVLSDVVRCLQ